jgi:hypothetical protein
VIEGGAALGDDGDVGVDLELAGDAESVRLERAAIDQRPQEGRLAGPARADQRGDPAGRDGERREEQALPVGARDLERGDPQRWPRLVGHGAPS